MTLVLKNLLFTVLVPGTVVFYVPLQIAGDAPMTSGLQAAIAFIALAIGGAIYAWCVWDFASFGRGTPAPIDAPKKLVIRGLYRYSRNPMYVGVLTIAFGWALLFASLDIAIYAACVFLCFHSFVRFYEEPHLAREFGSEYEAYTARVGRWLPRLRAGATK